MESVDHAFHSVRMAATRLGALVLCGDGDLVSLARSIHRRVRGPDRPFIVCDPKRRPGGATVRSAQNYTTGMAGLASAAGGTLCVRKQRLPPDFSTVVDILRNPDSKVQLVVCTEALDDCERYRVTPIVIPPVASRAAEIDRIIDEYVAEAIDELRTPQSPLSESDHVWVREHASTSLPDIEKATRRLIALRASRSVSDAATRLGMAPVSLSRWIERRHVPMEPEQ
jgi:hypothetical protein